jgi:UDP-glucose 4-epimerase
VAKLSIEHYLRFYVKVHGLQAVTLRMANVYGPRQDPEGEAGVVAIFCSRALDGQAVTVYGDGQQTRDYTYVKDAARAFLLALHYEGSTSVNIGTSVETSVLELIGGLEAIVGNKMARREQPARLGEIRRSSLDASWAKHELGWEPSYGLHEGLAETVRYFRLHR